MVTLIKRNKLFSTCKHQRKYILKYNMAWFKPFTVNKIPINYFQEQKILYCWNGIFLLLLLLLLLLYIWVRTNVRTNICTWMLTDKLKLNDDKTDFMLIGTKQQLSKVNIVSLAIGSIDVAPVTVTTNLATWFDSYLNLQAQIHKTCKSGFFPIYIIFSVSESICHRNLQYH